MAQLARQDAAPADGLAAYDFDLPLDRIAQEPASERDAARLLVLSRAGEALRHGRVKDLPQRLRRGDLLVFNDARVRPARLFGNGPGGGAVELLLAREIEPGLWDCLGRPAKRLRQGVRLRLRGEVEAVVEERRGDGRYALRFAPQVDVAAHLERCGELPLPPYIKRPDGPTAVDQSRYQTVFARARGAVAAPTAGLHFTPALLEALRRQGVELSWLTLHVGPATFMPVRETAPEDHTVEAEWAEIPADTVERIAAAKREGRRVIAVGTTATRALESAAASPRGLCAGSFWADAYIRHGFRFRVIDGLLTNFHLPRSTLLMLVCAFAGRAAVLDAYAAALADGYRFYSYGDAMLIE